MGLRRILMAFALAALLASGSTYALYRRLRLTTGKPNLTKVIAAAENLPVGITLTAKDVITVDWPGDVPLAGSFSKPDEVIGRPLIYSLGAKEPILLRDLGVQGAGIGLAGKIPPGMRATAVRSNEIVGVAGFLYPGSKVDVLATYNPPGGLPPMTQTILQNVEVLTAGQTIEPDPQGKPEQVNVVTLLLNPEDSQKLLLTSAQGTIQFVLRSGVDEKKEVVRLTKMDQLFAADKPALAPARPGARRALAANTGYPAHALEVIQGTQRSVQKF